MAGEMHAAGNPSGLGDARGPSSGTSGDFFGVTAEGPISNDGRTGISSFHGMEIEGGAENPADLGGGSFRRGSVPGLVARVFSQQATYLPTY